MKQAFFDDLILAYLKKIKSMKIATMKKSTLLIPLLALASVVSAQCPPSLDISTGYDQANFTHLADGVLDDDWLLTQTLGVPGVTPPSHGTVVTKPIDWHWVGTGNNSSSVPDPTTPAKWINYYNSTAGYDNWCNNNIPVVYQNGFCICGSGDTPKLINFNLSLHADNWAEVWILDGQGNPFLPAAVLSQTHQVNTGNFRDPEDVSGTFPVMMPPGSYSLALLQRNDGTSITGVSLSGTIMAGENGVLSWNDPTCNFTPVLNGTFYGSDVSCGVYNGENGQNTPNEITSGCQNMIIASTGYDNSTGFLIPDFTADDDWIVTQVLPKRSLIGFQGQAARITTKNPNCHWASANSKYMSYSNDLNGLPNWYSNTIPFAYQNGFCVCGPTGSSQTVKFDLALHSNNWSEVWLISENGTSQPVLLLSQTHQQSTRDNFENPADMSSTTLQLAPGPYSLAILHRNGDQYLTPGGLGATAVSLDAIISVPLTNQFGIINSNGTHASCDFTPTLPPGDNFIGTQAPPPPPKMFVNSDGEKDNFIGATIYPNPSNGLFNLQFTETNAFEYSVTDITGRIIIINTSGNSNALPIDLSNQPNGVYLLKVRSAGKTQTIKLMKQN